MTAAVTQFLNDFEGFLDTAATTDRVIDMNKVMSTYKLKPADVEVIRAKLEPRADEMEMVALELDADLNEAYSNMTKEKKREILAMYHAVLGYMPAGKARKEKKAPRINADGVIVDNGKEVAKAPKAPKATKVSKAEKAPRVGGKFTVAVLEKYRMVMVYTDAVVNGTKIDFAESYGVKLPKDFDLAKLDAMTSADELTKRIAKMERIKNKPSTTLSKFVTKLITF